MDRQDFEQLVADALDELPVAFREKLENVAVVVDDWPDREALKTAGLRRHTDLMGLYQGVPLERRTHSYGLVAPDKITLYQRPIELRCRSVPQLRAMIQHVLKHEIAHHFGIDDQRLRQIGAY